MVRRRSNTLRRCVCNGQRLKADSILEKSARAADAEGARGNPNLSGKRTESVNKNRQVSVCGKPAYVFLRGSAFLPAAPRIFCAVTLRKIHTERRKQLNEHSQLHCRGSE